MLASLFGKINNIGYDDMFFFFLHLTDRQEMSSHSLKNVFYIHICSVSVHPAERGCR